MKEVLLFSILSLSVLQTGISYALTPDEEAGKKIYDRRCWWCHGEEGAGDGPAADFLMPRPRDFTTGVYKFTSSHPGEVPLDEDIKARIDDGMPGSSMPFWNDVLSDSERKQMVAYIKTFSDRFQEEKPTGKINFGKQVSSSKESIENGKQLFMEKAKCFECHGEEGRGDATKKLKDDWGFKIWARDLRKPWTYRAGSTPKDIYTRITTGISGTPMPTFADEKAKNFLTEEERWHVVNYIVSLQEPYKMPKGEEVIKAKKVEGDLPTAVDDPKWELAPPTALPLVGQIIAKERWFTPIIDSIVAKALYNEKEVALLLEWDDRTYSLENTDTGPFNDQVSVMFPVTVVEGEKPYFGMGDPANPVNIWHWTSGANSLKESNATGFKQIKPQDSANITGTAVYQKGQWKVVVKRTLTNDDKSDVQLKVGQFIPIAFAAWDGSNEEKGSKHSLSTWYYILLEPPTPARVVTYPVFAIIATIVVEILIMNRIRKG